MNTRQITAANADERIKRLYESAFPEGEQIPWDDLMRLVGEMPLDFTAYYDGEEFHTFYGKSPGVITYEQRGLDKEAQWSNLWHVFIPDGYDITLSEMTDEQRNNRNKLHTSGTKEFLKWYKEKINSKKLQK